MYARKGCHLSGEMAEMGEAGLVDALVQFVAFCWEVEKNKEVAAVGKLVAVKLFNEQWTGLSLPLSHVRIKVVRRGV